MDPARLFILLNELRVSARKLEDEASRAHGRGRSAEMLVLYGAAQGYRSALRAVEAAATPRADDGDARTFELIPGGAT